MQRMCVVSMRRGAQWLGPTCLRRGELQAVAAPEIHDHRAPAPLVCRSAHPLAVALVGTACGTRALKERGTLAQRAKRATVLSYECVDGLCAGLL